MKITRSKKWDEGCYHIHLATNERLTVNSKDGMVIIDKRAKDMNVFTVTNGEENPKVGHVVRHHLVRFENKKLIFNED